MSERKGNKTAPLEDESPNKNAAKGSILGGVNGEQITAELEQWDAKFLKEIKDDELQSPSDEKGKEL